MGHGPSLQKAMDENRDAQKIVQKKIDEAGEKLEETVDAAKAIINKNTKGIIDGGIVSTNAKNYSWFSSHFDLSNLNGFIDASIDLAKITIANGEPRMEDIIDSIGVTVKAALGLLVASSRAEEGHKHEFILFRDGDLNYAFCLLHSATSIEVSNIFSQKAITVMSPVYVLALVEPNKSIPDALIRQKELDLLLILHSAGQTLQIKIANEIVENPDNAMAIMKRFHAVNSIEFMIEKLMKKIEEGTLRGKMLKEKTGNAGIIPMDLLLDLLRDLSSQGQVLQIKIAKEIVANPENATEIMKQCDGVAAIDKMIEMLIKKESLTGKMLKENTGNLKSADEIVSFFKRMLD